ncbi:hypothetical protein [Gemmata sp.]|uniref:hypothetical protein n=1 Tax=Gemmata sp. TaxID=1914242 RepID=UPI003F6FB20D
MPRHVSHVPAYSLHKPTGQAMVRVSSGGTRRLIYLGKYGTPESQEAYRRVLAELQTVGPAVVATADRAGERTVNEVLLAFMRHADLHYRLAGGTPTSEVKELKASIAPVRELYGLSPAGEFGPRALAAVRTLMVNAGWCRTLVNRRIDRVKRVFRWASSEELVPVTVYTALRTLAGLQRGRTSARESDSVLPVDPAVVAATLSHMSRHVRAMVELQGLTGMRPGEVTAVTFARIDRSGELWLYSPTQHKSRHQGKARVIPIGPKARAVQTTFLVNDKPPPADWQNVDLATDRTGRLAMADAYQEAGRDRDAARLRDTGRAVVLVEGCVVDPAAALFSPREAREERYAAMRAGRKSKVQPSQVSRKKVVPKRVPPERFTPAGYSNAVADAAERAGLDRWSPGQLRHTFATAVRRDHGLEAA